jgi:hypothetical protein
MNKKRKIKIADLAIKLLIFALFAILLYRQIYIVNDPKQLLNEFSGSFDPGNYHLIILAVLLAFANWSLESLKWKTLMSPFRHFSFIQSLKTIFTGIAAGIITPLQLGEYIGRAISVDKMQSWRSFYATFAGSIAQNMVTLLFGLSGMLYIFSHFYKINPYVIYPLFFLGIACVIAIGLIYYNIGITLNLAKRLGLGKIVDRISLGKENEYRFYTKTILNKVLMLSLLRYSVFTAQFVLLLTFFGLQNFDISTLSGISGVFLLQTGVPLPPVANFMARAEIAMLIFDQVSANKIMILASSFSLWLINLVLPSMIGLILIVKTNITKNLGYDD